MRHPRLLFNPHQHVLQPPPGDFHTSAHSHLFHFIQTYECVASVVLFHCSVLALICLAPAVIPTTLHWKKALFTLCGRRLGEDLLRFPPPPWGCAPAVVPDTSPHCEPSGSRVTVYFLTAYRDLLVGWKCTQQAFSSG